MGRNWCAGRSRGGAGRGGTDPEPDLMDHTMSKVATVGKWSRRAPGESSAGASGKSLSVLLRLFPNL